VTSDSGSVISIKDPHAMNRQRISKMPLSEIPRLPRALPAGDPVISSLGGAAVADPRPWRPTRRGLLAASAAAVVAAPAGVLFGKERQVKIDRIEVFPFRYPMTGFFKFFAGAHGAQGRAAVIVKVTADDGTVGWGQSVPIEKWSDETLEASTIAIRDYYAPELIGHDPTDIAGAHRIMDRTIQGAFSTGMPITRAGIDLALHDLTGKLRGQSLSQMWNRPRGGPLTLSWTVNAVKLDEVEPIMEEGRRRGYRHFNIKVAPDPKFDVELARRVRAAAPDGFLWADANGGYEPAAALEAAPQLADAGVDVLEAPIRPHHISGYQALKRQGALPILMDEGVVSPVELEEFIRLEMLDGVAMKPSRCGGLLSNKRQIEIVEQAGLMWLGSGLTDPDISLAATLGLYGAFGLRKPAALNGPQFLTADVLTTPLAIAHGMAEVPTGPGLGVDVDEAKIAELMRRSARRE
jgi:L-alanine-DL-glutamate epimerase-like enolase superfamily enzyme